MAKSQSTNLSQLVGKISGLILQEIKIGDLGTNLICDVSTGKPPPLVLPDWRRRVFDMIHNISHPSIRATKNLISSKFMWEGLRKQVTERAKKCLSCQSSKVYKHVKSPFGSYALPSKRFNHINVDIVWPFPVCKGYTYLHTIVDRFTRWPEAIPLQDISAATCARALISGWICRFGLPCDISSDRGTQFTSEVWHEMAKLFDIQLHHTTSYHP
ncbi:Transposon Tf2-9 polyprotein [Thelohanellus kitauei]|uniref:Transposon Tf2-9 polyprotein n=1 Tax=Thelohanellus kitauei TaxID=669202 RepID=A0A0C2MNQ2_THEKT|nr:Transposon Tf2-9 polyprotein [Thelohanellus kitauei]